MAINKMKLNLLSLNTRISKGLFKSPMMTKVIGTNNLTATKKLLGSKADTMVHLYHRLFNLSTKTVGLSRASSDILDAVKTNFHEKTSFVIVKDQEQTLLMPRERFLSQNGIVSGQTVLLDRKFAASLSHLGNLEIDTENDNVESLGQKLNNLLESSPQEITANAIQEMQEKAQSSGQTQILKIAPQTILVASKSGLFYIGDETKISSLIPEGIEIKGIVRAYKDHLAAVKEEDIIPIASNTFILLTPKGLYLIGAQTDTVKIVPPDIMGIVKGIIIPHKVFTGRVEPEFPIYTALGRIAFGGSPVIFIGEQDEIERIRHIDNEPFLGPTPEHLKNYLTQLPGYNGETAEQVIKEGDYMRIRPKFQPYSPEVDFLPLNAYVKGVTFDDTKSELGIDIQRRGDYSFVIDGKEIKLPNVESKPVIKLPIEKNGISLQMEKDTLYAISVGSGMKADVIYGCYLFNIKGKKILIETAPYGIQYLKQHGISFNEIDYIYISHNHRDHDNLDELIDVLVENPQIEIIANPLVYELALQKAADMLNRSVDEIRNIVRNKAAYPGKPLILEGEDHTEIKIELPNSIHPVFCSLGIIYSRKKGDREWSKELAYLSDIAGPAYLGKMRDADIISPERIDGITEAFKDAKVILVDVGEAIIHPSPQEIETWIKDTSPLSQVRLIHNRASDFPYEIARFFLQTGETVRVKDGIINASLLQQIPLFEKVSAPSILKLLKGASQRLMPAGTTAIVKGETSDRFFIIRKGQVKVMVETPEGSRDIMLSPGQLFGERGVISGKPANATVIAETDVELMEITKEAYEKLSEGDKESLAGIVEKIDLLSNIYIFRGIDRAILLWLLSNSTEVVFNKGEHVMRKGEEGDACYLVMEGQVRVYTPNGAEDVTLAILGPNEIVGERALFTGDERNASVVVISDRVVLRKIDRETFDLLLQSDDVIRSNVTKLIQKRDEK